MKLGELEQEVKRYGALTLRGFKFRMLTVLQPTGRKESLGIALEDPVIRFFIFNARIE